MIKRTHYGSGKTSDDRFIIHENGEAICYEKGVTGKDGKTYHCIDDRGTVAGKNPQTNGVYTYKLEVYDTGNNLGRSDTFTITKPLKGFLNPYHIWYPQSFSQTRTYTSLTDWLPNTRNNNYIIVGQDNELFGGFYDNDKLNVYPMGKFKKITATYFISDYLSNWHHSFILSTDGNLYDNSDGEYRGSYLQDFACKFCVGRRNTKVTNKNKLSVCAPNWNTNLTPFGFSKGSFFCSFLFHLLYFVIIIPYLRRYKYVCSSA